MRSLLSRALQTDAFPANAVRCIFRLHLFDYCSEAEMPVVYRVDSTRKSRTRENAHNMRRNVMNKIGVCLVDLQTKILTSSVDKSMSRISLLKIEFVFVLWMTSPHI